VDRSVIDLEKLRIALRRLSRGNLLMVVERAIEFVPKAKLRALVGDMVQIDELAEGARGPTPLLEDVRKFHDASLRGDYYESFNVNSLCSTWFARAFVEWRGPCRARSRHRRSTRSSRSSRRFSARIGPS